MKQTFKFLAAGFSVLTAVSLGSCSKDDDKPDLPEPDASYKDVKVNLANVPDYLIGGPTSYGANLYYGAQDQITTGYLAQIYEDTYAQFSINYGSTYDAEYNPVWGYSYFMGGMAISYYHDMENDTYENQLSVYHPLSPSGGNFVVAYGYATDSSYKMITDPSVATLSDYAECGRIYITDAIGYSVKNPGVENSQVSGEEKDVYFKKVSVMNTTYVYKVMEMGNNYAAALNSENKGWLKVQFIAFDDNDADSKPVGYVEAYLANFDESLEAKAGYCGEILKDWKEIDLSSLPEASILVVNFVGSDAGEYGLNTPTYCALDNFEFTVETD